VTDTAFFRDFAYVFVAALAGGLIARKLRQPLILGYVLGGIFIGPFTPGPSITDVHALELLAELGVILLMYSIGIEFSIRDLLRVRWVALIGGPLGIIVSILLTLAIRNLLGWSIPQAITIGAVISVASTMVLSRLLIDRGELHSQHGRVMIAITLVEDLAVVILTVLLPNLTSIAGGEFFQVMQGVGKSLLLLVPVAFAAAKLVPPLMNRVARTRSDELYLLVALALGFATAAIAQAVGLSLALGAFLAGVVVSESEHSHQTLAQLLPFRDAFVALFFVTMGALIDPRGLVSNPLLVGTMIFLVVVGKFVVWTLVVRVFRYSIWTAMLVGVGLTQIGEFSFILVQVARSAGIVGADVYNATLAVSLVTILLNAFLIRTVPNLLAKKRLAAVPPALDHAAPAVMLCGFGRVGSVVGASLDAFDVPYSVIEMNPDLVAELRRRGTPAMFGDASNRAILNEARVREVSLAVVTSPHRDRTVLIVEGIRASNPGCKIIARAEHRADEEAIRSAGADDVIQPESEAAATLVRRALDYLEVPQDRTSAYLDSVRSAISTVLETTSATHVPAIRDLEVRAPQLEGVSLNDARIRDQFGVTVLAIEHDSKTEFNPSAASRIRVGDKLRVMGLREQIDSLGEMLDPAASHQSD
jgi:CPA2 family monovalent cation:H+ antiporter-2